MQPMTMEEKLARIQALPEGASSPSGHYWCATCKKLFRMEGPTCPFMTKMCINQAIPVEAVPVPGTAAYERFGLFYPKIPQRALARIVAETGEGLREEQGRALAEAYLKDLA